MFHLLIVSLSEFCGSGFWLKSMQVFIFVYLHIVVLYLVDSADSERFEEVKTVSFHQIH